MEYQYNQISCFYSKGERILLIPKGELLPFGGGIDLKSKHLLINKSWNRK